MVPEPSSQGAPLPQEAGRRPAEGQAGLLLSGRLLAPHGFHGARLPALLDGAGHGAAPQHAGSATSLRPGAPRAATLPAAHEVRVSSARNGLELLGNAAELSRNVTIQTSP